MADAALAAAEELTGVRADIAAALADAGSAADATGAIAATEAWLLDEARDLRRRASEAGRAASAGGHDGEAVRLSPGRRCGAVDVGIGARRVERGRDGWRDEALGQALTARLPLRCPPTGEGDEDDEDEEALVLVARRVVLEGILAPAISYAKGRRHPRERKKKRKQEKPEIPALTPEEEKLAEELKLEKTSDLARRAIKHRAMCCAAYVARFRKRQSWRELGSQFEGMTVEEALREHPNEARKC